MIILETLASRVWIKNSLFVKDLGFLLNWMSSWRFLGKSSHAMVANAKVNTLA
jgi:hypothetical protein